MPSVRLVIGNQRGLHARAAAKFVKLAGVFDAEIIVAKDGQVVSGVSILGLMLLAAAIGEEIEITTAGEDQVAALAALSELVKNKFEES